MKQQIPRVKTRLQSLRKVSQITIFGYRTGHDLIRARGRWLHEHQFSSVRIT